MSRGLEMNKPREVPVLRVWMLKKQSEEGYNKDLQEK